MSDAHAAAPRSLASAPDATVSHAGPTATREAADGARRALDDEALRRLLAALACLRALTADLRSSGCEPRVPGSTADRETATERASAAGQLAAARVASSRLSRCPSSRGTLEWLAEHSAGVATVTGLARLLAEQYGPVALREAHATAAEQTERAGREAQHARARAAPGRSAPTVEWLTLAHAATSKAQGALDSARAREAQALAALVAWGRARIEAAAVAWEHSRDGGGEASQENRHAA